MYDTSNRPKIWQVVYRRSYGDPSLCILRISASHIHVQFRKCAIFFCYIQHENPNCEIQISILFNFRSNAGRIDTLGRPHVPYRPRVWAPRANRHVVNAKCRCVMKRNGRISIVYWKCVFLFGNFAKKRASTLLGSCRNIRRQSYRINFASKKS